MSVAPTLAQKRLKQFEQGRRIITVIDVLQTPKRRHRRWIIAGVVILVLSVAGWWYWPRGDARLVGKWLAYQDFEVSANNSQGPIQSITFYSNGTARIQELRGNKPATMFAAWRVEGGQLQVGYQIPAILRSAAVYAARSTAKSTRRYLIVFEWGNDFAFAGPD